MWEEKAIVEIIYIYECYVYDVRDIIIIIIHMYAGACDGCGMLSNGY